ncbi:cytochrome C oxidase subunit IV family protein [Halomonas beimenensis]|uniref:Putative subunit of Alternative cytochrome c oxidase n=1 Tax=Halomonas beimenensis TaxID=475662 RepID=A0A291P7R4_9GAMM|nr:cytochrome C oxidase subunit IV family protein [Halomonas beimenensis]ATJ82930.1 putative subunit of Alternative cytochrome c oxidase [Halomonas beimenensis]
MARGEGQRHPIGIYLWVWFLLFVLSVGSYLVDILQFEGYLRWSLITVFMLLKAGLIIAVFMHMAWERLAIICVVLVPPGVLVFLMLLMALEGHHVLASRLTWLAQ